VEVGIHGFMGSAAYSRWAREQGITIIPARQVEREGMAVSVAQALRRAGEGTDLIYVSVDIDCLAFPWAVGTAAATAE
jgi:arginase family enzyme